MSLKSLKEAMEQETANVLVEKQIVERASQLLTDIADLELVGEGVSHVRTTLPNMINQCRAFLAARASQTATNEPDPA